MEVKDVLTRLGHLGLDVRGRTRGGHYKVFDPKTGAWLFDVSVSPSDPNWHYNIARNLRRIGLSLDASKNFKKKRGARGLAVDLAGLQRAQEAARAAGERVPQLGDLDEAPPSSPLWKRTTHVGGKVLTVEAEQEVIENMVARADTGRVKYLRGRLENFMMEKGDDLAAAARKRFPSTRPGTGKVAEFARIAIYEVAPARGIRAWKNQSAAEQAVGKFLKDENTGLSVWSLALIEATMDHINGFKWGVYEIPEKPVETVSADDDITDDELDEIVAREDDEPAEPQEKSKREPRYEKQPPISPDRNLREKYIEVLLDKLNALDITETGSENIFDNIADRLDKLIIGEGE